MNEQIVKLITKADTHAWSVADKYVASDCCNDGEVNYLWEDAFREKFAELIVRECASLAYDGPGGILDHFGLEEHFGVEE